MGKPVPDVTKAEQRDHSQAGIVDWDWQAVPQPLQNAAQAWKGCCAPLHTCTRTRTHTHIVCTSRVGAGAGSPWETQFLGEGNHELLPPVPTSPEDWPGSLTGKRGVHSLWSQGPADAAPTL